MLVCLSERSPFLWLRVKWHRQLPVRAMPFVQKRFHLSLSFDDKRNHSTILVQSQSLAFGISSK
jgi:hypothetical protein